MIEQLEKFLKQHKFRGKGPLCVAIVITNQVRTKAFPVDPQSFLAESGTQVAGLGNAAVQAVLSRYKISKVLAKEGGRTSRGSVQNMKLYVEFLNLMHEQGKLDLDIAEKFWIARVIDFFSAKPFVVTLDPTMGTNAVVRSLVAQAAVRQKSENGFKYVGALMQYLVGATLEVVLKGNYKLKHHNASQNDQNPDRTGDFDFGDISIHVTTSPTEALIAKCIENLSIGRRPIIITGRKGAVLADGLAENVNISHRIDVMEFEQFISTNINELGKFDGHGRKSKFDEVIKHYNHIVAEVESDPSLAIEIGSGK